MRSVAKKTVRSLTATVVRGVKAFQQEMLRESYRAVGCWAASNGVTKSSCRPLRLLSDWTRFHFLLSQWASTSLRPHPIRPRVVASKPPSPLSVQGKKVAIAEFFASIKNLLWPKPQTSMQWPKAGCRHRCSPQRLEPLTKRSTSAAATEYSPAQPNTNTASNFGAISF